MIAHWYDVNGVKISIVAEGEDLLLAFDAYLAPFERADPAKPCDFSIEIVRGLPVTPPVEASLIFDGILADSDTCTLSISGTRSWLHAPGLLSVFTDQACRRSAMTVESELQSAAAGMAVLGIIDQALQSGGQALLHGAAFIPPGEKDRAVLLFAPSGRGKTTTALALALGGFPLITDDAIVLIDKPGDQARNLVWGLPRPLKVHKNTAVALPEIAPCLTGSWDASGEQAITLDTLSRAGLICSAGLRPVPACAIVLLGARTAGNHKLEHVSKSDTLIALSSDNIRRKTVGMLNVDIWRFERLAGLVAELPCLRLDVGTPLSTLVDVFSAKSSHWSVS